MSAVEGHPDSDQGQAGEASPVYRWHIIVRERNTYGDRTEKETPATILAPTRGDVTAKVRVAFGATFDDFRKFWSHDWLLESVEEVTS